MAELIVTVVLMGLLVWGAFTVFEHCIVHEYQHALLFEKGRFIRVLEPGDYWVFKWTNSIELMDARKNVLTVPGQEVLSKDGVTLKVSVLVQYRVTDPKRAFVEHAEYLQGLYPLVQTALREKIGETLIEELLPAKNELSEQLATQVGAVMETLGLALDALTIKDIMFPGPLKESFSQVARAKQEGLAALEKARGETAALRKLANAAKLVESNPELYRLRVLQSITDSSSIIFNVDGSASAPSIVHRPGE